MIPYALFMFRIIWPDDILDIRALEPLSNGFRFRVSERRKKDIVKKAKYLACFLNTDKTYTEIEPEGCICVDEDGNCVFTTEDKYFLDAMQRMIRTYMEMIRVKTEFDEIDAMSILSGLELSEDFANDISSWRNKFCRPKKWTGDILPVELGVSLDSEYLWEAFLSMEKTAFQSLYMKEKVLSEFDIAEKDITHVYIGNQFCPMLFPDAFMLEKLVNRAFELHVTPVIALAPMSQMFLKKAETIVMKVSRLYGEKDEKAELIINDFGTALMIKELESKGAIPADRFLITAGVLLNKSKKDPRIQMPDNREKIKTEGNRNHYNDDEFLEFLKSETGISRISYEGCGCDREFPAMETVLHIPLYQTNSSSCVMNSLFCFGERGKRGDLRKCPRYCSSYYLFYPDNVPLIGIGNSVFGISEREINDADYLNNRIKEGLVRIVLN